MNPQRILVYAFVPGQPDASALGYRVTKSPQGLPANQCDADRHERFVDGGPLVVPARGARW